MEILSRGAWLTCVALVLGACSDDDPLFPQEPPVGRTRDAGVRDDGHVVPPNDVTVETPARAGLGTCSSRALPFRVQDAEYAGALDRVVAVTAGPNALTLLDPQSGATQQVALPLAPAAVSVAPDGRTAAVAHDAYVSIVDLVAGTLTATISTTTDAADIVLAGDGFAYVFPKTDQWVDVHAIDIAHRREVSGSARSRIYADMRARLHPSGSAIYAIDRNVTPVDIERLDLSGGTVATIADSPYHGDFPMCDNVWFTDSGDRLFNGCGTVFRATPKSGDDLTYAGKLGGDSPSERVAQGTGYQWIVHSAARKAVYALRTSELSPRSTSAAAGTRTPARIDVHDDAFLQRQKSLDVPCLDTKIGKQHVYGRFMFVDPAGARLYVLGQLAPEAGAAQDWTSAVIPL